MRDLTLHQLHEVLGGRLRLATLAPRGGEQSPIERIVTDSREIQPGDTFFGLAGRRVDGSSFAEHAFRRGATGVVVAGRYIQPPPGCWSLQVDDVAAALLKLAEWSRERFRGRVVAVTGSVGKTTTREMIHAALRTRLSGCASPKNYNNEVGLPLSLVRMAADDDYAVVELAARKTGEIAQLSQWCQPHVGVITRISDAHLGTFGSQQSIAECKTELLAALPRDGHAVLAGDDPWLRKLAHRSGAKNILWVGRSLDCDVVATAVESRRGSLRFAVEGERFEVPVWGRHHLTGALAAIAVGRVFGLPLSAIADGLAQFSPPPMRCQVMHVDGATVINDTYNASPTAMSAALELLREFDAPGRRIVVCGDMRDLGTESQPLHRQLGDQVVTLCGADLVIACGEHSGEVISAARAAGMPRGQAISCRATSEGINQVIRQVRPGDVVLVKGSRDLAMEQVVDALGRRSYARAA
jgi:UDP-N-acetylmuramoyl-tripeptide--D-alanyl-D-alanine ligase